MGKRLLASFLAVAMMLTMAPFAFAAEGDVAEVNGTGYSTLDEAINTAQEGQTIKLLTDASASTLKAGVTYDLNGHNMTCSKSTGFSYFKKIMSFTDSSVSGAERGGTLKFPNMTAVTTAAITANEGARLNLSNIKFISSASGFFPQGKGTTLNIENCDITSNVYCVGTNAATQEYYGVNITLKNSTFTSTASNGDNTPVYINVAGNLNIDNCTLTGGRQCVMVRAGTANIANSTLTTTGHYSNKDQYYTDTWRGGNEVPAAALIVGNYEAGAATAYTADAIVNIENTKLTGDNGFPALYVDGNTTYKGDVSISGEDTVVSGDIIKGQQKTDGAVNIGITGGTFSSDVSDYCVSGYEPVKGENGTYTVEDHRVAEIDGVGYASLKEAFSAAESGKTVKLLANVTVDNEDTVDARTTIIKPITLDLNGKTIIGPDNMGNNSTNFCMLIVDADTTIIDSANGGGIDAGENGGYCINIRNGATLTINAGKYYGGGTVVQVQEGTAVINGGSFDCEPYSNPQYGYEYMINCLDDAYRNGTAKVSITGGTFVDFNPANCQAEGEGTNFCAPGYKTELTNGVYVVKAGTNDAINAIDAAIKDGATEAEIKAAVDAVASTPNATLANSSTTMDKLAKLEEKITNAQITVETNSTVTTVAAPAATNAKLSADPDATHKQKITIDVASSTASTEAAKTLVGEGAKSATAMDITMKLNNQPIEPKAPVVLTFDLPDGWDNAQIVYMNGATPELVKTTVSNGKISGVFNHFSTYVLVETKASKNPNEYEIILTPNTYDVSAGDTLTYTVSLKHTEGDGTEGMFTFVPDTTSGLLSDGKFTPETGLTNYQFGKDNGKDKLVLKELNLPKSGTKIIGTLSYTVQAYPHDNTKIEYTGTSEGTVSNEGRQVEATVRLINDKDVTYHVVKVTFSAADGTMTEGYVKYGKSSPLYATLDALKIQDDTKKVTVPVLSTAEENGTGGTDYRVPDNNWHLSTDDTQVYPLTSGIKTSVTFVENYVKLAKVTIPQDNNKNLVQITKKVTRTVGNDSYVDQSADLEFKLTDGAIPKPGMKYEVKVKVGGGEAFDPDAPGPDGTYKVEGTKITGNVEFVLTQKMALTADDIKIFTDTDTTGQETYRDYSTYSGKKTLVLIKGDAGAKYQFNTTSEQHPTIYKTNAYDGYNFGVLIDPTNVGADKASMLAYMVNVLGLNVVTSTEEINPTIEYNFNTNGLDGAPLADAQVTRDFIRKAAENGWYWSPTDDLLLKADVITAGDGANPYDKNTYKGTADGRVSADDLNTFMYLYVGMPKTN